MAVHRAVDGPALLCGDQRPSVPEGSGVVGGGDEEGARGGN